MTRVLLLTALVTSLIAPISAADAANTHRHKQVQRYHHAHTVYAPPPAWNAPASMRQAGPPWAGPNQCFEDLGYGRFSPCDNTK